MFISDNLVGKTMCISLKTGRITSLSVGVRTDMSLPELIFYLSETLGETSH